MTSPRATCPICNRGIFSYDDVGTVHGCGHSFHYECIMNRIQVIGISLCPGLRGEICDRQITNVQRLSFQETTEDEHIEQVK